MKIISVAAVEAAAPARLPGYLDAVRAAGRPEGDRLILSDADYAAIRIKYRNPDGPRQGPGGVGQARFLICKACANSKEGGFGCVYHKSCCFGAWRSQPANHCPEGKW